MHPGSRTPSYIDKQTAYSERIRSQWSTDLKITLKVATPAGIYEGTFDVTAKIHDVIAVVVKEKHLVEGDAFELVLEGERPRHADLRHSQAWTSRTAPFLS